MPAVSLLEAFWWGTVAASGVFAGALMGVYTHLTHTAIAATMTLGAGMLLAAASVELASESVVEEPVGGIIALLAGAVSFSLANAYLATRGAKHRKRCGECVSQPREGEHPVAEPPLHWGLHGCCARISGVGVVFEPTRA
jgi:ZIP family zinc transporter